MNDAIIGRRPFVDGSERDVFQAADGRQYVQGDDGTPVHGWWAWTDESDAAAPLVVPRAGSLP